MCEPFSHLIVDIMVSRTGSSIIQDCFHLKKKLNPRFGHRWNLFSYFIAIIKSKLGIVIKVKELLLIRKVKISFRILKCTSFLLKKKMAKRKQADYVKPSNEDTKCAQGQ